MQTTYEEGGCDLKRYAHVGIADDVVFEDHIANHIAIYWLAIVDVEAAIAFNNIPYICSIARTGITG